MAGRPGHGGQNRIDPKLHVLRGTYRPERHQAALLAGQPLWTPQPAQLGRLGPDGLTFVQELLAVYDFTVVDSALVLEAGIVVDRLAEIRAARLEASLKERLALDKTEQWWQRQLSALVLALRIRP